MSFFLFLATAVALITRHSESPQQCRCLPSMPCFSTIPWAHLNNSLDGLLMEVPDELNSCISNPDGASCKTDLSRTDDEFFYTGQVGGYLHTGLATSWSIAHKLSK